MNCPTCAQALSERGSFCKFCGAQARCLTCREILEPDAVACVECGAKVGVRPNADPPSLAPAVQRNTLTYREDRNSRHFEASLTDNAIQGLGSVLGDVFIQRGAIRPQPSARTESIVDSQIPLPLSPPTDTAHQTPQTGNAAVHDVPDNTRILRLFHADGTTLELKDNRLKANTGADFLRRLTYLFLYAHECHGRPNTPKADLIKMLDTAKILDNSGNARRWLARKQGFNQDEDENLKLTQPGREAAVEYLNQALNPELPDQWNPDKKTKAPRKRKAGTK